MVVTASRLRNSISVLAVGLALGAAGCTGSGDSGSSASPSGSTDGAPSTSAALVCPPEWAEDWQSWADRVDARIYCPTFVPSPITAEIDGRWNTAKAPGEVWQLGYAWLEHEDLVHLVFEGFPEDRWPVRCSGRPCIDGKTGTETIAGHEVTWYDRNKASHSGHIAAVFRDQGYVYVVSMHVGTAL